jgi:hypothetical protein
MVNEAQLVLREQLEILAHKGSRDRLELQVLLDPKVRKEIKGLEVLQDLQDHKVLQALQGYQ